MQSVIIIIILGGVRISMERDGSVWKFPAVYMQYGMSNGMCYALSQLAISDFSSCTSLEQMAGHSGPAHRYIQMSVILDR